MDANEGVGDPSEQFHRNEAISAVADEGFLGEEDDDYEDLYNDVNVGENFLQSMRKNEDSGYRDEDMVEKVPPKPASVAPPLQMPSAVGGDREAEKAEEVGVRNDGMVEGYQSMGFRGGDMGAARGSVVGAGGSGPPGVEVRADLGHSSGKVADLGEQTNNGNALNQSISQQAPPAAPVGNLGNVGMAGNDVMARQGGGNVSGNVSGGGYGVNSGGGGSGGGTILFVGDLHWWTTDAELEAELCKYGPVKEVKFFDERASGKSKGYCQVEFFDPAAATACKERMDGFVFNGRPCVVAYASPFTVKKMGEAQQNRNQQMAQTSVPQARRGPGDAMSKPAGNNIATGGNYQGGGGGDNNRGGFNRGNWGGRGGSQGMVNRGPLGPMRNRPGGVGGRGLIGNGGNSFGQGIGTPPLMHPQPMMGHGFDPAFAGPMGRVGGYGAFPGGPTPPFSGMMPSFPPVGSVGLPGIAPHVNPAFFGRGMPMNGMGMMPGAGVEGPNMGMWSDMNMGWTGEEHGGRAGESSYNEEAVSDHQHGEVSHDRVGAWPGGMKEKDRGVERDWSGSSDRRFKDDKEQGFDREMPREKDIGHEHDWSERKHRESRDIGRERERDRERSRDRDRDRDGDRNRDYGHDRERDHHRDDRYTSHHRYRDHDPEYNDDRDRGKSSRTHAKEEHRSRSRDADYGKRRRMTSD